MLDRPEVQCVIIDLPRPLSANQLWRPVRRGNGAAMVKSKEYLSWISECGFKLNVQRPGRVSGPYCLHLYVTKNWRGDLGNAEKAVSDILQSQGIVDNDKLCQAIRVKRADIEGMRCLVVATKEG